MKLKTGLDTLALDTLNDQRIGVLAQPASINGLGDHILDILAGADLNITTLFGPEHGIKGIAEDMEAVNHSQPVTRNPQRAYSLYGTSFESLKPTSQMFENLDTLIIDLQDVGARYYTYIYTMAFCMETAARCNKKVIVLDRPNPINGIDIEGELITKGFESFVGWYPLPNRHAMTIGELANYFNKKYKINCDLQVIKMNGWNREMYFDDTKLPWVNPSPNMRSLDAAILYPGMCLLEGTNVSEGRGTDAPFEKIGAPWINAEYLINKMLDLKLPGIKYNSLHFTPNSRKFAEQKCSGIHFEITDRNEFRPYLTGLALIWAIATSYKEFKWRSETYEFVEDIPAIDLLTGSNEFRKLVDDKVSWSEIKKLATYTPENFLDERERYLLYT